MYWSADSGMTDRCSSEELNRGSLPCPGIQARPSEFRVLAFVLGDISFPPDSARIQLPGSGMMAVVSQKEQQTLEKFAKLIHHGSFGPDKRVLADAFNLALADAAMEAGEESEGLREEGVEVDGEDGGGGDGAARPRAAALRLPREPATAEVPPGLRRVRDVRPHLRPRPTPVIEPESSALFWGLRSSGGANVEL